MESLIPQVVANTPKQTGKPKERAFITVKSPVKENDDPFVALLSHRSTPLEKGYSSAELLIGRTLRTFVPIFPKANYTRTSSSKGRRGR